MSESSYIYKNMNLGQFLRAASVAAIHPAADMELRLDLENGWNGFDIPYKTTILSSGGYGDGPNPGGLRIGRYNGGGPYLEINWWSASGGFYPSSGVLLTPPAGFWNPGRRALRVQRDYDNGAGQTTVTAWYGPTVDGPWTLIGSANCVQALQGASNALYVGGTNPVTGGSTDNNFNLSVRYCKVWASLDESNLVLDGDFAHWTSANTEFGPYVVDPGGNYFNPALTDFFVDAVGRQWQQSGCRIYADPAPITDSALRVITFA